MNFPVWIYITVLLFFVAVVVAISAFVPIYYAGVNSIEETIDAFRATVVPYAESQIEDYFEQPQRVVAQVYEAHRVGAVVVDTLSDVDLLKYMCSLIVTKSEFYTSARVLQLSEKHQSNGRLSHCDSRFAAAGMPLVGSSTQVKNPGPAVVEYYRVNTNNYTLIQSEPPFYRMNFTHDMFHLYEGHIGYFNAANDSDPKTYRWGPPYTSIGIGDTQFSPGISWISPVTNQRTLFMIDVLPHGLQRFLKELVLPPNARAAVADVKTGWMIGISWNESLGTPTDRYDDGTATDAERIKVNELQDFNDTIVQRVVSHFSVQFLLEAPTPIKTSTGANEDRILVDVVTIDDGYGLNLRFILMIREGDFIDDVYTTRTRTIGATVGVVIFIIGIGALLGKFLTRPFADIIHVISGSATLRLGGFDDNGAFHVNKFSASSIAEVQQLQDACVAMQTSMRELKAFVPQNILCPADSHSSVSDDQADQQFTNDGQHVGSSESSNPFAAESNNGTPMMNSGSVPVNLQSINASLTNSNSGSTTGKIERYADNLAVNLTTISQQSHQFTMRHCSVLCIRYEALYGENLGNDVKTLMNAVIPQAAERKGVIEELRPDYCVISFGAHSSMSMHSQSAAICALNIAEKLSSKPHITSRLSIVLDEGDYYIGTIGKQGRLARVLCGENLSKLDTIHHLTTMYLGVVVIATSRIAAALPQDWVMPIDCVTLDTIKNKKGSSSASKKQNSSPSQQHITLYSVKSPKRMDTRMLPVLKKGFAMMRQGDYLGAQECLEVIQHNVVEPELISRLLAACSYKLEVEKSVGGESNVVRDPYVRHHLGWDSMGSLQRKQNAPVDITRAAMQRGKEVIEQHLQNTEAEAVGGDIFSGFGGMGDDDEEQSVSPRGGGGPLFQVFGDRSVDPSTDGASHPNKSSHCGSKSQRSINTVTHGLGETSGSNNVQFQHEIVDDLGELPSEMTIAGSKWTRSAHPVGEGAFSTVYRIMNSQGSTLVVKCIPLRKRDVDFNLIRDEIATASQVQHENLVPYVACDCTSSYVFLTMEYVAGGSIMDVMKNFRPLPSTVAKRFAADILQGLTYLHSKGIVHCDVKPANILVGLDGVCKVADFGSSFVSVSSPASAAPTDSKHNEVNDMNPLRGTSTYMAPEVAKGSDPTPPSDVWSFGVLFCQLITGQLPFNSYGKKLAHRELQFVTALARLREEKNCTIEDKLAGAHEEKVKAEPSAMIIDIPANMDKLAREVVVACLRVDPLERPTMEALLSFTFML